MSVGSRLEPVDAEAVAAAVAACPSVVRLVGGEPGFQIATYLPGRRVVGVRITEQELEIHIASAWDVPVADVAAEVRAAVEPLAGGLPIAVAVDDVEDPHAAAPPVTAGGTEAVAVPAPS